MRTLCLLIAALGLWACVQDQDDPTHVHDLRVLGMAFEPPEVLMEGCNVQTILGAVQAAGPDAGSIMIPPELQQLLARYASTQLEFSALIADPAGNGRQLSYALRACSKRSDRQCDDPGQFVTLQSGTTTAGEFHATVRPGFQFLEDGTPLILDVVSEDTYKGIGGIRLPVVLELSAPDTGEHLYAQKLMVYTCQFFPQMKQNVTPVLPGILWDGGVWAEDEVKEHSGRGRVPLEPIDFSDLQEPYVVPSLTLQPVDLVEAWKVTWTTTSGSMSSYNTGGTDFVGVVGRHNNGWTPDPQATTPQDVTLYFVVRDGRGGSSWVSRRVHWTP